MKKLLLLTTVLCIFAFGYSQKRAPVSKEFKDVKLTRHYKIPTDLSPPMTNWNVPSSRPEKSATLLGNETEIIETLYDLQTNAALNNRIWAWEDGTVAAVCTRGITNPAGFAFPDRGTGYNYFDGTAWAPKPTARLEVLRAGWPSIAPLGEMGEIIVSHNFGVKLIILTRPVKGTGAWTETYYNGPGGTVIPSWPRVVTSGENNEYVQMIYNTNGVYEGQATALLYSRSSDGGQTWDIQDQLLDGVGSDYYLAIAADDYVMTSKGNTVVILCGSPWFDLFMLKSTDNGETWEKTVIWEHPYPFFDMQTTLTSDTLWCMDASANAAIDNNGQVHVVWGVGRVARLEAAPPDPGYYNYWPYSDGIGYWNESMGAPIPEADNPHHTMSPDYLESLGMLCGWTQDVNNSGFIFDYEGTGDPQFATYRELGISTMPSIAFGPEGDIAVAYASTTETFVTADGLQNYKHIWLSISPDMGYTWGEFHDVQVGNIFHIYDECIYPLLAQNTNNYKYHLLYQADNIPGLFLDEDHDAVTNREIYNVLDSSPLIGISENTNKTVGNINVSTCYPNPASGLTTIQVELFREMNVSMEITNLTGQKVMEIPAKAMQAGSHTLTLDASALGSGVYFYTVKAGNESVTKKLIVE